MAGTFSIFILSALFYCFGILLLLSWYSCYNLGWLSLRLALRIRIYEDSKKILWVWNNDQLATQIYLRLCPICLCTLNWVKAPYAQYHSYTHQEQKWKLLLLICDLVTFSSLPESSESLLCRAFPILVRMTKTNSSVQCLHNVRLLISSDLIYRIVYVQCVC